MAISTIVQGFRDGLAAGDLLIQRCGSCSKFNMYPRYVCPHCQSNNLGWHRAGGTATLMSFTVLRAGAPEGFESELPYALAVVRLTEGVQLLARLTADADGEWASYACDATVTHVPAPDKAYAVFGRAG